MPGQVPDTTMKTGTGKVIPGHNHIYTDITTQVIMTHIETAPGHNIGILTATPEVGHDAHIPHTEITAINPATIHHMNPTVDHSQTEVPQLTTPEIERDPTHVHPTIPWGEIYTCHIYIPADHKASHPIRRTPE